MVSLDTGIGLTINITSNDVPRNRHLQIFRPVRHVSVGCRGADTAARIALSNSRTDASPRFSTYGRRPCTAAILPSAETVSTFI